MNIFKKGSTLVWFIVTSIVLVVMIVLNILAVTVFASTVFDPVFGGGKPITADGVEQFYLADVETKEEARLNTNKVNEQIVEEGMVLLKNNNGLPLKSNARVSIFGKNSANIVNAGSGSAASMSVEYIRTIFESFDEANITYNPALKAFYENNSQSGNGRPGNPSMNSNDTMLTLGTGETPWSSYVSNSIPASYATDYKDAAIIVISRISGEDWDLPRVMGTVDGARQASDHYLQLDANETQLVSEVCSAGFEKVIVLLNSSAPMEVGFLTDPGHYAYNAAIDACLWIGVAGDTGIIPLGKVLSGEVTPSGRLIDTYVRDFKADPTWQNFGNNLEQDGNRYTGVGSTGVGYKYSFVDYEEGIYVGYRYYETRAFEEGSSAYSGSINGTSTTAWANWHDAHVVYPFGYGLSYTTFTQSIVNKPAAPVTITQEGKLSINVRVENTGSVYDGKDTVQIYVTPPKSNTLEKSYVSLVAFDKTVSLGSTASTLSSVANISLEVDPYDFATWDSDYTHADGVAKGGYVLDAGDYEIKLMKNAHEVIDSFKANVASRIVYEKDPVTQVDLKNRFEDADDQLGQRLSRADFAGTFPQMRSPQEKVISAETNAAINSTATTNPLQVSSADYPNVGIAGDLVFRDLVDEPFESTKWDELIDQLTISEMKELVNDGAFKTAYIRSIAKPKTTEADGPAGFVVFMGDPTVNGTSHFACEPLLASSFNAGLLFDLGEAIGNEGLFGDQRDPDNAVPYSGWYSPGINIHRSPFGGRVGEYFSEDPYLSGKLAASQIEGAASKGVYCYMKHFVANEQETDRDGVCTWMTEQTLREIYLRPFEIAVKEPKTPTGKNASTAIMSSFNRIGTVWTGGDYRLLTEVLRSEWGFRGTVICDYNTGKHMDARQMIFAGGDLNLRAVTGSSYNPSNSNATDITILRTAVKNILYTTNNSNIMNADVLGYRWATWKIVMVIIDAVIIAMLAAWGVFVIIRARKPRPA